MNQINKKWIVLGLLLMLIIAYFVKDYCNGVSDTKRRALFMQVKKGMNKEEVTRILGKPDTVRWNFDSSAFYYEYFVKNYDNTLKSGMPTIVFDSIGKVEFTSFGD